MSLRNSMINQWKWRLARLPIPDSTSSVKRSTNRHIVFFSSFSFRIEKVNEKRKSSKKIRCLRGFGDKKARTRRESLHCCQFEHARIDWNPFLFLFFFIEAYGENISRKTRRRQRRRRRTTTKKTKKKNKKLFLMNEMSNFILSINIQLEMSREINLHFWMI